MSGDVQPRKRKDKKRKKDDLGVEEPRGTAAALGEGDVFMHSHHDHGTGGHWCAKIIFFSLLAVLITLIGLIILENRGLSELEANAVESRYSGVLEGWLEDAPDDDHHDEHTLELTHHDDNDEDDHDEIGHSNENGDNHDDEEDHSNEDVDNEHDNDDDEEHGDSEEQGEEENDDEDDNDDDENEEPQNDEGSEEQDLEDNDEDDEEEAYRKYYQGDEAQTAEDDDNYGDQDEEDKRVNDLSNEIDNDDEDNNDDDEANDQSLENYENEIEENDEDNEGDSEEQNNEDEEEHEEEEEDEPEVEVEKIEKEASEDEEPISTELPVLPEPDDDDDDDDDKKDQDSAEEASDDGDGDETDTDNDDDDNDDFLEADDDEPPVERITAPSGKPFDEVEDESSSEKPTDTLEDEEEYERKQEELRREEAQASHMWMKLTVGGALLVATYTLVRRATSPGDASNEEHDVREETPVIDRRMTLIPEEPSIPVPIKRVSHESTRPVIQEVTKQIPSIVKSVPTFDESDEEIEEEEAEEPVVVKNVAAPQAPKSAVNKELYSDEEADDEEVEEEEEEKVVERKAPPQTVAKEKTPEPEPEEDVPDDVEIIDDEQIEEEMEEEDEDEEEISDVDDEELLSRLEAKYGRLPEPERPQRHKDGGNSIEDWPGEPSDAYWRQQLDQAEQEFNQGEWMAAAERASSHKLSSSARARYIVAKSLDAAADAKRDNAVLNRAIAAYLELLKMNTRLSDKRLREIAERTLNRMQFRGTYLSTEPVYRLLIRRFPNEVSLRNNLTIAFLMSNRADLADEVLKETLRLWPNDRLALAHYGFVLKTHHNRLEEAVKYLQRALEGDIGAATEPRFYYHLGDALLLLNRFDEAHEVHKRGAAHGHFLSPAQRSLYNVPRLKSQPWWNIDTTPYTRLARALEKSWTAILKEGEEAKAIYEQEKEGLKERGEWSQLDLFVRGQEVPERCKRAPVTCSIVKAEAAAAGCRRGQVKFSLMAAGTHVRPHVGPTNCRLRMHLGLSNTKDTYIRVDKQTRQWKTGKVFMFDDSFEHEVWHNGTGARLVLIVDVWHPDLTPAERRQLPAI